MFSFRLLWFTAVGPCKHDWMIAIFLSERLGLHSRTSPISTFCVPGLIGNLQGKSNRFTSPDEWQRRKKQFQASDVRCKQLFSPKELRLGPFRSPCCALHFPLAGLEPPVKKPRELKVKSWHCIPSWSVCQQKSYDCDLGSGRLDARGKLPHDHSKYQRYRGRFSLKRICRIIKGSWEAIFRVRMALTWSRVVWGFASHNNTQNEGWCERTSHNNTLTESTSQSNTLNEGWCETLHHKTIHSMKGGVRLYITKQYTQWRVVWDLYIT